MLTRDLLLYRVREGVLRPSFVDVERPELAALAADLVAILEECVNGNREELEEALTAHAAGARSPKVGRGLCKLLLDRAEFEEPQESVAIVRRHAFDSAAAVLRALPADASVEHYEERLAEALPEPLPSVRSQLYADLPGHRRVLGWRKLSARGLLERYNLALAQGLVLHARALVVEARRPQLLQVRRVLRWLRFCRLVAEVLRHDEGWKLEIEGPASILELSKKYGLQLATFLPALPLLEEWRLEASIRLPRRADLTLRLSHEDPLVSPHGEALGHIPPEVELVAKKFEDGAWALDLMPEPRHVGPRGICVPDLTFRHRKSGVKVCFELFHRWHHGPLARRLQELRSRPDPELFLGVDRVLSRRPELSANLEGHEQVMLFNTFPSEKKIREILRRFEPAAERAQVEGTQCEPDL